MMLSDIYDGHAAEDKLPAHRSQSDTPDPTQRIATSIRHWIQFSDWYTTLPHVILYTSFDELVLRLNRTTLDELRQISRRMAQHNALVADQLRNDWRDILLKVASNSPNHAPPRPNTPTINSKDWKQTGWTIPCCNGLHTRPHFLVVKIGVFSICTVAQLLTNRCMHRHRCKNVYHKNKKTLKRVFIKKFKMLITLNKSCVCKVIHSLRIEKLLTKNIIRRSAVNVQLKLIGPTVV